jgi:hypothetical protein
MLDGYTKYSLYTKKGVKDYNETFSAEEFDALTA